MLHKFLETVFNTAQSGVELAQVGLELFLCSQR